MEGDRIVEELKVRENLVGGYWAAIPEGNFRCQVSDTERNTVSETFDTVED